MQAPRHIVVGTDLSDASRAALETAAFMSKTFDTTVTLMSTFDPTPFVVPMAIPGPGDILETASREVANSLTKSLEELRDEVFGDRKDKVAVEAVRHPSAGEAIADVAERTKADLVIVGSHGRTGFRRVLLGSVAEKVVRVAPCAVLVARTA